MKSKTDARRRVAEEEGLCPSSLDFEIELAKFSFSLVIFWREKREEE